MQISIPNPKCDLVILVYFLHHAKGETWLTRRVYSWIPALGFVVDSAEPVHCELGVPVAQLIRLPNAHVNLPTTAGRYLA